MIHQVSNPKDPTAAPVGPGGGGSNIADVKAGAPILADMPVEGFLMVDEVNDDLYFRSSDTVHQIRPADETAAVEDLIATVLRPGALGATQAVPVMIAKFPLKITAASLVSMNNEGGVSVAVSDTNYWTVTIRRFRAGSSVNVVTKSTQATGGAAIPNRQDWSFDTSTWDNTNATCQVGDVIDLGFFVTGNPTDLGDIGITLRYEPV